MTTDDARVSAASTSQYDTIIVPAKLEGFEREFSWRGLLRKRRRWRRCSPMPRASRTLASGAHPCQPPARAVETSQRRAPINNRQRHYPHSPLTERRPAVSSPEASRTPAPERQAPSIGGRHPKTLNRPRHSAALPGTSVVGGEADETEVKAVIADGMSEVGGIADVNRTWPPGPSIAMCGRWPCRKKWSTGR